MSSRVGRMETPSSNAPKAERLGGSLTLCWWGCKADSNLGVPQQLNVPKDSTPWKILRGTTST